ncbi:Signal transduction histidine-protein kinase AtoS [Vibrio stylophorae]|uniref:histidine kinase n=1 Tax=Vibrio stylophorae TaxID=659351 RepID=A0ABM8ZUX1_9VIBR|nr:ATP-binding protein [Vibrio stylophorae]CAH0534116.1 Signal transduction histidine-protein kinase AtoS [Vibrio stylophorae]
MLSEAACAQSNPALGSINEQLIRYKQVIDVMPAGVILLNNQGVVAEANPEAQRLLSEPLVGQRWFEVIQRDFDPKDDDGHEVSLRSGGRVKLAISASESGQLILITDMTETRLLQSRVSDLQRLSSLGKMVASLAHQVRTPLSSAMLYAANLGAPNLPEATRTRFQSKLLDRLQDLEKQVNDMLLFAKGGDNKVVNTFSSDEFLTELAPMVEMLVQKNQVDYHVHQLAEGAQLLGNVNALASAVSNLIVNAIQVAGKGCAIALHLTVQGEHLLISVTDNGPGIAPEIQQKIIEPFFTTRKQGTGLGLAVVQMVCHAHKGQLKVISEVGKGACFSLVLPLNQAVGANQ